MYGHTHARAAAWRQATRVCALGAWTLIALVIVTVVAWTACRPVLP